MKTHLLTATLFATLSTGALAQAMNHDAMSKMGPSPATTKEAAPSPLTDGTVVKIDTTAGTITLQHPEVKSVGMPAMTMAYKAKDPAMLTKVKAGDKVGFSLVQQPDQKYAVDAMERKN